MEKQTFPQFHIIQALCRCSLCNPSNATKHQVERLKKALQSDGYEKEALTLNDLLNPKPNELSGAKIVRSGKEDMEATLLAFANWLRPKYPDTNAIDVQTFLKSPIELLNDAVSDTTDDAHGTSADPQITSSQLADKLKRVEDCSNARKAEILRLRETADELAEEVQRLTARNNELAADLLLTRNHRAQLEREVKRLMDLLGMVEEFLPDFHKSLATYVEGKEPPPPPQDQPTVTIVK